MLHQVGLLLGAALLASSTDTRSFSCSTINRVAYFLFCNLSHVPTVPEDTVQFSLSLNYILEVNATSFAPLEKLVILDIGTQHTKRLTVRKDAFRNLPNLRRLDLGGNVMLLLDPDAFTGLFRLTDLRLYHNQLDESILENDYFRDLASLEFLDLDGNKIQYLRPNPLFYYLYSFQILSLKLNQISTICEPDLHSFQRKYFQVLDLSSNNLYHSNNMDWAKCGNPFRNIEFDTLILSGNGFTVDKTQYFCKAVKGTKFLQLKFDSNTLGAGFGYNNFKDPDNETFANLAESNLKILDISSGSIFSLNPHVFANLTQLIILILSNNKINFIQKEAFYGLMSLEILNLTQNLLGEIYEHTFNGVPNLTQLDLKNNHIGAIQQSAFGSLTKLTYLNLQDNALKTLYFFARLPGITYALLGGNRLTNIYNQINASFIDMSQNRLENLQYFYALLQNPSVNVVIMRQNRFSYCYSKHTIEGNNNLQYLDLGSNYLQLVWNAGQCLDVFRALSKLETLHLDENYLRFLPEDIFNGLSSLKKLNLSSNRLAHLPNNIFPGSLAILDLSRNQLVSPDPMLFASLSQLDITNNRFICDCSLSSLIHWVNQTNVTLLGSRNDIFCIFPSTMVEVPLQEIITDDCEVDNLEHLSFSLFILTAVTLILFITSVVIYTHFRGYTFILYKRIIDFILGDQPKEGDDTSSCRYDAYLCYSSKDFEWVQNVLVKNLDSQYCEKNRFNVCFEERDFIPGEDHIVNIRDAIWNSKKTICIVTKHFLRDGWCVEAFNYAQSRYYSELKDVLIMVVVGALSQYQLEKFKTIRSFVQRRQYLRWPEDLQDVDWFLDRLSTKILKEQSVEKKLLKVSMQTNTMELHNISTIS